MPTSNDFNFKDLFNQTISFDVKGGYIEGVVEGWYFHTRDKDDKNGKWKKGDAYFMDELVVRINPTTFTKSIERYMKNYLCLNPNGAISRLYIIPKEIVRQNVEGEITQKTTKRARQRVK